MITLSSVISPDFSSHSIISPARICAPSVIISPALKQLLFSSLYIPFKISDNFKVVVDTEQNLLLIHPSATHYSLRHTPGKLVPPVHRPRSAQSRISCRTHNGIYPMFPCLFLPGTNETYFDKPRTIVK